MPLAPGEFRDLGLSFVHQDLALLPSLTVVENLRAALIAEGMPARFISWRAQVRAAREVFARYGLGIDPRSTVADLRPVERAMLAIVRAVEEVRGGRARRGVLILDEPTVFLPKAEVEQLFRLVREVAEQGSSVLFVSHDLEEVREVTDRVTVLRDGRVAGTAVTAETTEERLVELIIGRRVSEFSGREGRR